MRRRRCRRACSRRSRASARPAPRGPAARPPRGCRRSTRCRPRSARHPVAAARGAAEGSAPGGRARSTSRSARTASAPGAPRAATIRRLPRLTYGDRGRNFGSPRPSNTQGESQRTRAGRRAGLQRGVDARAGHRVAPRARPGARDPRDRRRLDRRPRPRGRGVRRPRPEAPVQPRHRRRRAVRLPVRTGAPLRLHDPGRRRRPARSERDPHPGRRDARAPGHGRDLRLALPQGPPVRRADQPPRGDPRVRVHPLAPGRPAGHRPDVGLPALQPPRDRPLRARLPARLPRGGGRARTPLPPAPDARGSRQDVSARRRRVIDPEREVDLLHDQGAAGDLRGTRAHPADRRARRRGAGGGGGRELMELRIQIVAVLVTAVLLFGSLELVRSRRLLERYAVLWLFCAIVLLSLAVWKGLLEAVANAVGIYYAPSALFVVAFGFILVLLLHFSVAVSRMSEQAKVLAQRLALLEERNRQLEAKVADEHEADEPRRRFESPSGVGERERA